MSFELSEEESLSESNFFLFIGAFTGTTFFYLPSSLELSSSEDFLALARGFAYTFGFTLLLLLLLLPDDCHFLLFTPAAGLAFDLSTLITFLSFSEESESESEDYYLLGLVI